jgi:protoporphyrin/coproporphyrin ferrochelatase
MTKKIAPFQHGKSSKAAVVLVNLGTPQAPTADAVRPYLREFLSDSRVVEIPRLIWWLILNCIIVPFRSKKTAAKYAAIWTSEGSPLKVHTEKQAMLLRGYLGELGHHVNVVPAMRYGQPALPEVLDQLHKNGCDRVLILPAYPQYSGTTTASIYDAVLTYYKKVRNVPELRFIKHYHDHAAYIAALKNAVLHHWSRDRRGEHLVMSFHGVPKRTLLLGDPYHCECQKTARLLAESLGLNKDDYTVTFQSRFGKAQWLQPYTLPTVQALARKGIERIDVICPGFISDCLETLEEINIEVRREFLMAGGKEFNYIPCLNEDAIWIRGLTEITQQHLQAWPTNFEALREQQQQAAISVSLAKQLGAEQ